MLYRWPKLKRISRHPKKEARQFGSLCTQFRNCMCSKFQSSFVIFAIEFDVLFENNVMIYEKLFTAIEQHVPLSEIEKDSIRSFSAVKKFRKHQYLLQEGNISYTENFVVKGCLRSYEVNEKGQEHVIQFSVEDW